MVYQSILCSNFWGDLNTRCAHENLGIEKITEMIDLECDAADFWIIIPRCLMW